MPNDNRPFSIVSAHTDFELCAVAELLSPVVSHTGSPAEEQEATGVALDDDFDDYLDASIRRPRRTSVAPYLLLEFEEPFSPPHPSYSPASGPITPSESESESFSEDNLWHPHAPLPSTLHTSHLPRRVRARKQSSACVSTSDSDTPSLSSSTTSASSSHSRSYSPLRSPATLETPIDHIPLSHSLAIIDERFAESRTSIDRRESEGSGGASFASPDHLGQDELGQFPRPMEVRTKNRNIENLRVNVPPRSVPFPIVTHSPMSTIVDTHSPVATTRTVLPGSRPGLKSLTRIMSPVSKSSRSFELGSEASSTSPTRSVSTSKSSKEDAKEEKTRKAEAKKMKKAEQKAKVERLAEELKERKRRQTLAHDRSSVRSDRSGSGEVPVPSMYGGLGTVM